MDIATAGPRAAERETAAAFGKAGPKNIWRRRFASLFIMFVALCAEQSFSTGAPESPAVTAPPDGTLVTQGEYLVRAANCVSCHTAPRGEAFAGGKGFQTTYSFLGQIYSSNITPDRDTGIGAWSEADFVQTMRMGIAPGGRHLFPAFPYTAFTKLSAPDLEAIFAYLKSLPAVHSRPPANSFWFRQRWVMPIWNWFFFTPGEQQPSTNQTSAWNRGAYLVEALGHCGACHRPRNLFMAERSHAPLSGGVLVDDVQIGKSRAWSAPDLTGSKSGLGAWTVDDLRKYLGHGYSRRGGVFGPMNEVFANSLRFLADEDIAAMAIYLKSAGPASPDTAPTLAADARATGQTLYDKHCDECHLPTGHGAVRKGPSVAGSAVVQARNPVSLINVILYGAAPSSEVAAAFDAYDDMPGFQRKLNDREVADLATFLRANWGNAGGPVSRATVAAQR